MKKRVEKSIEYLKSKTKDIAICVGFPEHNKDYIHNSAAFIWLTFVVSKVNFNRGISNLRNISPYNPDSGKTPLLSEKYLRKYISNASSKE